MNAHSYAISIEHILRNVFNCERGGFAGLIDADSIEKNSYVSIACALGYLYAKSYTAKQADIEKFINAYGYYLNFGIRELILFKTSERGIGGTTYTIDFDNGEKALEVIVKELSKVCKRDI